MRLYGIGEWKPRELPPRTQLLRITVDDFDLDQIDVVKFGAGTPTIQILTSKRKINFGVSQIILGVLRGVI